MAPKDSKVRCSDRAKGSPTKTELICFARMNAPGEFAPCFYAIKHKLSQIVTFDRHLVLEQAPKKHLNKSKSAGDEDWEKNKDSMKLPGNPGPIARFKLQPFRRISLKDSITK